MLQGYTHRLLRFVSRPVCVQIREKSRISETEKDPYTLKYRLSKFIFMPEQNIYMVRPYRPVPDNVVVFHVDMKFSKFEIKNYLEQIYGLKVAKVNTMIKIGKHLEVRAIGSPRPKKQHLPDKKVAYVVLAEGKFTYPDVSTAFFSEEEVKKEFTRDPREDDDDETETKVKKKKKKPKYEPIKGTVS